MVINYELKDDCGNHLSIQEAREKLDLLEKIENENKPELVFTELISQTNTNKQIRESNLLYSLQFNGHGIRTFIKNQLKKINVFSDIKDKDLDISCRIIEVYIPTYPVYNSQKNNWSDNIMEISLYDHTYKYSSAIEDYNEIINEKLNYPELIEFDEFYKKLDNLTFTNRFKYAIESLYEDDTLANKICNSFFWIVIPKKYVNKQVNKENQYIQKQNQLIINIYKERLKQEEYNQKHAPEQIEKIKNKQNEIANYLNSLGYTRVE